MTMNKVKEFCKEHKADIAIGVVSAVVGGFLGEYLYTHPRGGDKTLLRNLKAFGGCQKDGASLIDKMIGAQAGATHAYTVSGISGMDAKNIGEKLMEVYQKEGFDTENPITGVVLFHTNKE